MANQLFATLDPTIRRVKLPNGRTVLLSDTVGFIQKLPVTLIAAFRATLEEVIEADVLLHVVDAHHPLAWDYIDVVEDTLAELDATRIPKILVLNKSDLGGQTELGDYVSLGYQEAVQISALRGEGLDEVLSAIGRAINGSMSLVEVFVPYENGEILAEIHRRGVVESEEHLEVGVRVRARVPVRLAGKLDQWRDVSHEKEDSE